MKSGANLVLAVIAALSLGSFGWRIMAHAPHPPSANAGQCAPQQIRAVADATERAILSARCAQRAAPAPAGTW